MSPENCKAGALPTELHPHADLQFCIAPRPMHGSTALNSTKHHRNFEWRGPGWWSVDRPRLDPDTPILKSTLGLSPLSSDGPSKPIRGIVRMAVGVEPLTVF